MYSVTIFETCLGWMAVVWSQFGLRKVILPHDSKSSVLMEISRAGYRAKEGGNFESQEVARNIMDYLSGKEVEFHCRLDFQEASDFQQRVWSLVRDIPWGEVRSYSWVAAMLGLPDSVKAVGQALARNPFPIVVPCHRVIRKDGNLGGYSGGVELKGRLLRLENCDVLDISGKRLVYCGMHVNGGYNGV